MPELRVVVASPEGLHARPAAAFIKVAGNAGSPVTIAKGEREVDAASILSVLSLGIVHGDEVVLRTEGSEEDLAPLVQILEDAHAG